MLQLEILISGIGSLTFSFWFFYILTCFISIAGTEKGSAHTWFWRGEDDSGAVFSASLCNLSFSLPFALPFLSFQPCFVFPFLSLVLPSLLFLLFSSSRSPLSVFFFAYSVSSPFLFFFHGHCFSLAFTGQRMPCGGNDWLLIRMQSDYSLKACSITDAIQRLCCRKRLSLYCWKRLHGRDNE